MFSLSEAYQAFLKIMKKGFRQIYKATNYEIPIEDLEQDAFLAAKDLERTKGRVIDFSNPADQELIMRAVHVRNVVRPEKHMQFADSIDTPHEGEEGEIGVWEARLYAEENTDPLVALILREAAFDNAKKLADSYSQAVAYLMVLARFGYNKEAICSYLVISDGTLSRRVSFAADTFKVQNSLFDRIERITEDFMPRRGKAYEVRAEQQSSATQWAWEF